MNGQKEHRFQDWIVGGTHERSHAKNYESAAMAAAGRSSRPWKLRERFQPFTIAGVFLPLAQIYANASRRLRAKRCVSEPVYFF